MDKNRKEVHFTVGQWCFVRLQPYRQILVGGRHFSKLSKRFYGPFQIVKHVGPVAYKLALPATSKIHLLFHVSVHRLCPNPDGATAQALPSVSIENSLLVTPLVVLDSRRLKRGDSWVFLKCLCSEMDFLHRRLLGRTR